MGDLLLFAYLLALGRFFLVLSALDTGSAFEGMGAAREVTFACFAEPAMFFCLLVLAKLTGSLKMVDLFAGPLVAGTGMSGAPLLLVLMSWMLLMLAENCRIPFDDPNTHLELTMIHEVIVLDHSGPLLALLQLGTSLKLFVFASLLVRLAIPLEFQQAWIGYPVFVLAVCLVAVLLGTIESVMARLRMPLVPHVLTAAAVTAAFGFVLLVTLP
jgi:formate hydrogenlyase subunit 4